jgi:hypothetical protein
VTRQNLVSELVRNVAVVLLVILVTAISLYPVIISLNNGVLQLSSKLMHCNIELMEVLGSAIARVIQIPIYTTIAYVFTASVLLKPAAFPIRIFVG